MRILAISGSLRSASLNTALLRAVAALAPETVKVELWGGLGDLPNFNPELDGDEPPAAVADYRSRLNAAAGVLISSPEYAHGVPGVLKNALDWVVGSGELVGKPVALLNASPRAQHAQASLVETLTVMTAVLVEEAAITVPLLGKTLDEHGMASDPQFAGPLRMAIDAFARAIASQQSALRE